MASSLFEAYLSGAATPLYGGHFALEADRRRAVQTAATRRVSEPVARALEGQQASLPPCEARTRSIELLRSGAAAVVTGQQMGLFLGPLYTVYKAATAIRVARALHRETGAPVVPVFWLQTEDHDLAEVAECHVPRLHGGHRRLCVPVPADNRVPVAQCRLGAPVLEALEDLRAELAPLPHASEHLSLMGRHYRPEAGWAEAFVGTMAELFAGTGLLFLNPRDPRLLPSTAPVHGRALDQAGALSEALLARVRLLESHGFTAPIHVRDGAPLSFLHRDGTDARVRLVTAVDGFEELGEGTRHAPAALVRLCHEKPERFSTSALLRPILQDTLLPTAAYVGGPAEVAYFAQLPPLYEAFGLPMPLIVPRARFQVLEERTHRHLGRLGLAPSALAQPTESLLRVLASRRGEESPGDDDRTPEWLERQLREGVERTLRSLSEAVGPSAGLERAFEKTRRSMLRSAARLRRSYERKRALEDAARVEDLNRVRDFLYPDGHPQERFYGVSYFAARVGGPDFLARILDAVVPFDASPREVTL